MQTAQKLHKGVVVWSSRRHVMLYNDSWQLIKGTLKTKSLAAAPGDRVEFILQKDKCFVENILPRTNLLRRTAENRTKELAANLDHVFLITAPAPLFNTAFVDRVLAASLAEKIPCTLVLNKIDLLTPETENHIKIYEQVGLPILQTSATTGSGIEQLKSIITSSNSKTVLFTGVSGVGKSSLISNILPDLEIQIGEISHRIGQGRHTTTQPQAYHYKSNGRDVMLIDIPGILRFGVEHLSTSELMHGFSEIWEALSLCEFKGCMHTQEQGCAVLERLKAGKIAMSRYQSYRDMLCEVSKRYY